MQHKPLMDPTTLSQWRSRLGADKLEVLLKQTIDTAKQKNLLKERDLTEVNVDTTVQPKAIAFPTDSRLYFKMTHALVRGARKAGVVLRQCYVRVTKAGLVIRGRYAHARQMNLTQKHQRKLHTILGPVTRDIGREISQCSDEKTRSHLEGLLKRTDQLLNQTRTSSPKLFSIHHPMWNALPRGRPTSVINLGTRSALLSPTAKAGSLECRPCMGIPSMGTP